MNLHWTTSGRGLTTKTLSQPNMSFHDMTAQVPFIWDTEHEKQHHDVSVDVRLILQNKPNCWTLNKQVEKRWCIHVGALRGEKGKGSRAGSVVLVKVLPAFGSFRAPCWFSHDDLWRETKSDKFFRDFKPNENKTCSQRVLKGDTSASLKAAFTHSHQTRQTLVYFLGVHTESMNHCTALNLPASSFHHRPMVPTLSVRNTTNAYRDGLSSRRSCRSNGRLKQYFRLSAAQLEGKKKYTNENIDFMNLFPP